MIDLHSHVLHDFDDGARNPEESEEILKNSAAQGVTCLLATSHAGAANASVYEEHFRTAKALAEKYSITLLPGLEYSCRALFHRENDEPLQSLGTSRFLLLDCGNIPVDQALLNRLMFLTKEKYRILLAHPERIWLGRSLENIELFSHRFPVAVQVNAGSLLGIYGRREKREAWKILEAGCCHVIASDAHHSSFCRMAECRNFLARFFPPELLHLWFEENPARILADQMPLPVLPSRKGFLKRLIFRMLP